MMAGPSSPGTGGAGPSSKRARPWSFLLVSSWFVYDIDFWLYAAPVSSISELALKSGVVVMGVAPHWFRSSVGLQCAQWHPRAFL
jgi:hypothetical protein